MKWWYVLTALAVVSGCSSGGTATDTTSAATTTVAIAAPTTSPPTSTTPTTTAAPTTTTAPPTTIAATTAPPTTVPADPIEAAEQEVAERYEAFSTAGNECVAAAATCDLPTVLGEFANPDAALYQLYETRWLDRIENNSRSENLDRIERSVTQVEISEQIAVLTACVVDGSVVVDSAGAVLDDSVGYRFEETFWQRTEGTWKLVGGTTYRLDESGGEVCSF